MNEAVIKIQLDYAPTENGDAFKEWCDKHGFDYLSGGRRAWCGGFSSYFRNALGVATTPSGEQFLFWAEDVTDNEEK